jgi:flagellar basal-body rod protein FlgG
MLEGLYSAAAGMAAQQQQLDAISNDLANESTTGYKSERIGFEDLLYNEVHQAGTATSAGAGASAELIGRDQSQGSLQETGNPLDLAIQGNGYFQVKRADGQVALTRDGTFGVDGKGSITNAQGDRLEPPITLPTGTSPSEVSISPDGTVSVGTHKLGQIKLVTVPAADQLLADGGGLFTPTASSGTPRAADEATVRQGALESSNVDMATEMAKMVSTQRDYQLSSTSIQMESQMMSIANQLRTGGWGRRGGPRASARRRSIRHSSRLGCATAHRRLRRLTCSRRTLKECSFRSSPRRSRRRVGSPEKDRL